MVDFGTNILLALFRKYSLHFFSSCIHLPVFVLNIIMLQFALWEGPEKDLVAAIKQEVANTCNTLSQNSHQLSSSVRLNISTQPKFLIQVRAEALKPNDNLTCFWFLIWIGLSCVGTLPSVRLQRSTLRKFLNQLKIWIVLSCFGFFGLPTPAPLAPLP